MIENRTIKTATYAMRSFPAIIGALAANSHCKSVEYAQNRPSVRRAKTSDYASTQSNTCDCISQDGKERPARITPAMRAAARERSRGQCECDGLCARDHTGRCPNVEGALAAGSRNPVRLRIVDGRELCAGCCAHSYSTRRRSPLIRNLTHGCAEIRAHEHTADPVDCRNYSQQNTGQVRARVHPPRTGTPHGQGLPPCSTRRVGGPLRGFEQNLYRGRIDQYSPAPHFGGAEIMTEQWKGVPGYEGLYEVSDLGRVRSLPRADAPNKKTAQGRVLSDRCRKGKYQAVHLYKLGKCQTPYVHHLVLLAFVGPRPNGAVGCHNNGNRLDNRSENLRWDSPLGNARDAAVHGTIRLGSRNPSAKLIEEDVVRIREMILFGANRREVENVFRISKRRADCIVARGTWRHVS